MPRTGRPKRVIDKTEFEKLCYIQCTMEEVAAWFDCDVSTIQRWIKMTYKKTFAQVYGQKKGKGKISLRRSIYQRALDPKGPPAIAIFLAKNHLGMSDKIDNNITTSDSKLVVEFKNRDPKKE